MKPLDYAKAQSNLYTKSSLMNTLKQKLRLEYEDCKPFYLIFIPFFIVSMAAPFFFGDTLFYEFEIYFRRIKSLLLPLILVSVTLVFVFAIFRRGELSIMEFLKNKVFTPKINQTLFTLFCASLTYFLFLGCFLYWKMKIPMANPFSWDSTFAQADALLLGGHQAGELFLNTYKSNFLLQTTDTLYLIWGGVTAALWLVIGTLSRLPKSVRSHYFLACLVSWVFIGLIMATFLSSAGPVYYGHVTGDYELYAPLFKILGDSNLDILALPLQDFLWAVHSDQIDGIAGISAMPSMHNAQALLFILLSFHLGRLYIILTTGFAVFILFGSVILGWHYLVDGLVSYVLVLPIWYITGKITKNNLAKTKAYQAVVK